MKKTIFVLGMSLAGVSLMASSGEQLAQKCVACHGSDFSKAPLGETGHIVSKDSKEKIVKMLKYYKHPEEADEKVMQLQIADYSNDDINKVAEYIVNLRKK